jgi:hypothetical protein
LAVQFLKWSRSRPRRGLEQLHPKFLGQDDKGAGRASRSSHFSIGRNYDAFRAELRGEAAYYLIGLLPAPRVNYLDARLMAMLLEASAGSPSIEDDRNRMTSAPAIGTQPVEQIYSGRFRPQLATGSAPCPCADKVIPVDNEMPRHGHSALTI